MLKKTITFEDLDGNKLTEDFYFNLSKADIAELELSQKGGLSEYAKRIVEAEDGKELVTIFKDLIARSVGVRSEDGRRFIKNDEVRDNFMQTNAYSELFVELATNAKSAAEFFNGIVPSGLQEEMEKATKAALPEASSATPTTPAPLTRREEFLKKMEDPNWVPTQQDLIGIDQDLFEQAFIRKQQAAQNPPL